jgi:hypothetical protein
MSSLTDEQIKASILEFLVKKGRWGAHYYPLDTMVRWLGKKVRKNGKRVRTCSSRLVNEGYLLMHKRGQTVSLNPSVSKEIVQYIERVARF